MPGRCAPILFVRVPSWWGRRRAHPENVMAPLDIGYAIALLARRGVAADLLDLEAAPRAPEEVRALLRARGPSHVFLHAATPAVPLALDLARFLKESLPSPPRVIMVGPHATALPQTLLGADSPVDLCIRGEFERAACEAACSEAPAAGTASREDGRLRVDPRILELDDLDDLPLPSHDLFRGRGYRVFYPTGVRRRWRWGFVLTSRGCPYRCVYCSPTLRNSSGARYRFRSTAAVVDELEQLAAAGVTVVHFKDDVFTANRERVLDLCGRLRARGLRLAWTAQTRPDLVDAPLLAAMRAAGCRTIGMGVESGSQRVLDRLQKGSSVEDARRAFRAAREAGIRTVAFFLLGSPGEAEEDVRRTHALMCEIRPSMIQVAFFTPYPGSAAFTPELGAAHAPADFSHYNRLINLSALSEERLRAWQRRFYLDLVLRTRFLPEYARSELVPALVNLDRFVGFARLSARFLLAARSES